MKQKLCYILLFIIGLAMPISSYSQEPKLALSKMLLDSASVNYLMGRGGVSYYDLMRVIEIFPNAWQPKVLAAHALEDGKAQKYKIPFYLTEAILASPAHPTPHIALCKYLKNEKNGSLLNSKSYKDLSTLVPPIFLVPISGNMETYTTLIPNEKEREIVQTIATYLIEEDIISATSATRTLTKNYPQKAEYTQLMAVLSLACDDFSTTRDLLKKIDSSTLTYTILNTDLFIKTKDTKKAIDFLKSKVAENESMDILLLLVKTLYTENNYSDAAVYMYKILQKNDPLKIYGIKMMAESYISRGQEKYIYSMVKDYFEKNNAAAIEIFICADLLCRAGEYDKVITKYSRLISPNVTSPLTDEEIFYEIALLNLNRDVRVSKLALDYILSGTSYPLIATYLRLKTEESNKVFDERATFIMDKNSKNYNVLYTISEQALERGRLDIFDAALKKMLAIENKSALNLYSIGTLYQKSGEKQLSAEYIQKADIDLLDILRRQLNYGL